MVTYQTVTHKRVIFSYYLTFLLNFCVAHIQRRNISMYLYK